MLSSSAVSPADKYVFKLNQHDVLLGRGPPSFNFEGNFRYRKVADSRKDDYRGTESTQIKGRIAEEIMNIIHKRGGRFVRRVIDKDKLRQLGIDSATHDDDNEDAVKVWEIVTEKEALNKIKHTLRGKERAFSTASKRDTRERNQTGNAAEVPSFPISNQNNLVRHLTTPREANRLQGQPVDSAVTQQLLQLERESNRQLEAQIAERDLKLQVLQLQMNHVLEQQLVRSLQSATPQNEIGSNNASTLINNGRASLFSQVQGEQQAINNILNSTRTFPQTHPIVPQTRNTLNLSQSNFTHSQIDPIANTTFPVDNLFRIANSNQRYSMNSFQNQLFLRSLLQTDDTTNSAVPQNNQTADDTPKSAK